MKRNLRQNAQLHMLLSKLKVDVIDKKEMIAAVTNGRTESSADLEVMECNRLINQLKAELRLMTGKDQSSDQQRKKILYYFHELNYETPEGKIDWSRVNPWILNYGYLHKPLNDYTNSELPKLVTQVENIYRKTV